MYFVEPWTTIITFFSIRSAFWSESDSAFIKMSLSVFSSGERNTLEPFAVESLWGRSNKLIV